MPKYDSIPDHATTPASDVGGKSSKPSGLFALIALVLIGVAIFAPSKEPFEQVAEMASLGLTTETSLEPAEAWPQVLWKIGGGFGAKSTWPTIGPTNTASAKAGGWAKVDEPCNPLMGQAWSVGGVKASFTSASIYFTPEVGDSPGVASGIEVDVYGYVEDNLVGSYFGEEKTSADGSYRSVSISFFDGAKNDLCDTDSPFVQPEFEYLSIAPDMADTKIPLKNDSELLTDIFHRGACIVGMGYHWGTDVVGGKDLTWQAENLAPVVPMYSSTDGMLNAVFFIAPGTKQTWPADLLPERNPAQPVALPFLNMWDASPGLTEPNNPGFFACSNFCGDCQFTGSPDGMYTTMHWFFRPSLGTELCAPMPDPLKGTGLYCPDGDNPTMNV